MIHSTNPSAYEDGMRTIVGLKNGATALLLMAMSVLAACNTVQGVGKDLEAGGEAISDGARKVQQSF
jgi:predicted small secreted protein